MGVLSSITKLPGAARYQGMEGIRAYAVLLTFAVHYFTFVFQRVHSLNPNRYGVIEVYELTGSTWDAFMLYLFRSQYGVDLFFILSGFLIYRMLIKGKQSFVPYVKNRLMRIYPVFLVSLAVAIFVKCWLMPQMTIDLERFIKSLVLVYVDYNGPAWSLRYELIFYVVMPAIIAVGARLGGVVTLRWIFFGVFCLFMWASGFPRFAMFFAGAMVASFSDKQLHEFAGRVPDSLVAAIFLASTTAYAFIPKYNLMMPFFAITFGLFFIAVVFGAGFLNRAFTVYPMRFLGNVSYSFYMIHGPALGIGFWLSAKLVTQATILERCLSMLAFSFAVTVILSVIMFLTLELPYFKGKQREASGSVVSAT